MAASEAKLAANKRNGALSRGPKTDEGKAISSRNAIKHGILSAEVLLPDEDGEAFDAFAQGLSAQLAPHGELEHLLADRVISCAWRLRRAISIESQVLARESFDAEELDISNAFGVPCPNTTLGLAFIRDCNESGAVEKLNRYETAIERAMLRAMHELERLQARRGGQDISPPAVLDVALSVEMANPDVQPISVQ